MKTILSAIALTFVTFSASAKSLNCEGYVPSQAMIGGLATLTIQSSNFRGEWMNQVVATAKYTNYQGPKIMQGRRDTLEADTSYTPRVYANHWRFALSKLTDTKQFGSFQPGDQCEIALMIPFASAHTSVFPAAAVINCDQSGGSITLKCQLY